MSLVKFASRLIVNRSALRDKRSELIFIWLDVHATILGQMFCWHLSKRTHLFWPAIWGARKWPKSEKSSAWHHPYSEVTPQG